jgi:hypothetical protein
VSSGARPMIGRIAGVNWTMRFCVFAGTIVAVAGFRAGTARATNPMPGPDLATQIETTVGSQIDTAMAVSTTAFSQVAHIDVPHVQVASTMSVPEVGDTVGATINDAIAVAPVDATAPLQPPVGENAAERNLQKPSHHRPRALPQARGRSTVPGAQLRLQAGTLVDVSSPPPGELRPVSGTHESLSRPKRPAARPAPRPLLPLAPPAPGAPGASATGQGSGQGGGFPAPLSAALAGFVLLAISLVLRRVVWSALSMPRRVALPPWRPG